MEAWILYPSVSPEDLSPSFPWWHLSPWAALRSNRKHYSILINWEQKSGRSQRGGKRQREGECCQEKGDESLKMDSVSIAYAQGWIPKESDQTLARILPKCSSRTQLHLLGNKKCPPAAAWNNFNTQTAILGRRRNLKTREPCNRFCSQTQANLEYLPIPCIEPAG